MSGSNLNLIIVNWQRCKRDEAEQHRSRVLTGSIGLEGPWTDWADGVPKKSEMNREYEYRKRPSNKK